MGERNHTEQENDKELSHIWDNLNNHSDVEVGVLEDSEEVEESEPHSQSSERVEDSDSSVVISEDVHDLSSEDEERWNNIEPVPEVPNVLNEPFLLALDDLNHQEVGSKYNDKHPANNWNDEGLLLVQMLLRVNVNVIFVIIFVWCHKVSNRIETEHQEET